MMLELSGTNDTPAPLRQRGERVESKRRLESIKKQRRRARREKWSPGTKPRATDRTRRVETAN